MLFLFLIPFVGHLCVLVCAIVHDLCVTCLGDREKDRELGIHVAVLLFVGSNKHCEERQYELRWSVCLRAHGANMYTSKELSVHETCAVIDVSFCVSMQFDQPAVFGSSETHSC